MDKEKLKRIVESLLFIADQPVTARRLKDLTGQTVESVREAVNEIGAELAQRGSALSVREVAGGFQMATASEYGEWIKKLYTDRITYRLSKSALETLSIIAYKQPITRAEIEEIRGVDAAGVLENLLEKKLVRMCGRKEAPGRPILYGTTNEFLKYFGLKNISEMPPIDELIPPEPENGTDSQSNDDSGSVSENLEECVTEEQGG